MTNAQKWVAVFLAAFVVLLLVGKMTESDEIDLEELGYMENTSSDTEMNANTGNDAVSIMKRNNCSSCHGNDFKGTRMAPALSNLSEYWTRDGLINYLRNPVSYSGDDRFKEYKKTYKNIIMPAYGNVDVKDLGKVADYLLKLK